MNSAKKLITFWICLLVSGCGQEMLALQTDEGSKGLGQCTPEVQKVEGPFTRHQRKVILNDVHIMKKITTLNSGLPDDTEVAVTVDHSCLKAGNGGEISKQFNREVAPKTYTYYLKLKKGENYGQFQAAVERDSCILYVSDTRVVKPSVTSNDPSVGSQEHLKTIDAFNAWNTLNDSIKGVTKDVVVAIIDSGVDSKHEDLRDNMWNNSREVPGNGRDDDNNGYIDDVYGYNFADNNSNAGPADSSLNNAHGTHVAGLTGARSNNSRGISGVLGHHIKLMALNVFGASSGAYTVNIDNAIRYAADNGADVINMSLGGCGYTASTDQALSYAISKGVTIVVAAGNSGAELSSNPQDSSCGGSGRFFDTPGSFGSKYDGMITVASTDANSSAMSSFSNYSRTVVEMAAPGSADTNRNQGLLSTVSGSRYDRMMGTSMASPVVAGAAAAAIGLMRSRGVRHSNIGVENLLKNSAQKLSSLSSRVKDGNHLSLSRMVDEINKSFPPPTDPVDPTDPDPVDPPVDQPIDPDQPVDPGTDPEEPPVFGPPTIPDNDPGPTSPAPVAGPAPTLPDLPLVDPEVPETELPNAPICN